ncbi:MAG: GNAT family N-acetyltransferase [Gammaproteobacteria bacterium]
MNALQSRRMQWREFDFGDAQSLIDLDADPRVREYLIDDPVDSPTKALLLIQHLQSLYADGRGLGIWRAADDEDAFLGYFSLMPVNECLDQVEIGVRLRPEAWGKFYALEGGRALCDYAFDTLNLRRLVGYCDPGNRVIGILLRRLGFRDTGLTTHFERHAQSFERLAPSSSESRTG